VSDNAGPEQPAAARAYRVDLTSAQGVQVGDGGTQHNYFQFFAGTWTDGVAPQPLAGASGQVESPYRGLEAFGEADADFFFGRDTAIGEVLSRLSDCLAGTGLLVISGVSGAGKTSLLRAGVLRELRRTGLPAEPEAARWPCVVLVPGGSPLSELALAIAPATGADAAAVRQSLGANPADFALTARQAAQFSGAAGGAPPPPSAGERRVLLVVDQFETVFTQCDLDEERTAFIAALCAAAGAGAAVVVIVIRADIEARLADYPELADAVQHRYLLGAMTERQLRLAITEPAAAVHSAVDDDLVAELLREARAHADRPGGGSRTVGAGVLPLLSHALDQAWRGRSPAAGAGNAPLILADYERTGGIDRAVADSAQAAYAALTAAQQAVAEQVFTRLTATTADGIDTAVRATRAELLAGKDGSAAADVAAVLTAFAAKRLLTLAAEAVEISHEILLSAWPLLRDDWLAATRADRAARARLQATVTEWLAARRDPSFLYNGSQLDAASRAADQIAADRRQTSLSREERAFLSASRRAARHATRVRRAAVAGIAVLAAGLAVALVIAVTSASGFRSERNQARNAEHSAQQAQQSAEKARQRAEKAEHSAEAALVKQTSSLLASESLPLQNTDPVRAAKDSVLAWGLNPQSPQARYALQSSAANPLTAVFQDPDLPVAIAFSPDGKTLSVTGQSNEQASARLWNLVTDRPTPVSFTVGSIDSLITGIPFLGLIPEAFSPDGKSLLVADQQKMIRWDTATGRETAVFDVPLNLGGLISLALSPDGKTLAAGGIQCGCVDLLDAATGRQIGTSLAPLTGAAFQRTSGTTLVAFSPDGKTLITVGPDTRLRRWKVATHQRAGPAFPTQPSTIESLAVSPDGTVAATGADDGTVRLWDLGAGTRIGQPLHAGARTGASVETVAFSPDGSMIAAGDDNSTVRIWTVATQRQVGPVLSGGVDNVLAVVFSPDSRELASADNDGSVRLWNLAALTGSQAAPPVLADVSTVFSLGPDGKLATSDSTNYVTIWQPVAGIERDFASSTVPNPPSPISNNGGVTVALSPDGRTLATGANDGSVRLWKLPAGLRAGTPARTIPGPPDEATVQALAFSPDSRRLAVDYASGAVVIYDPATGQPVTQTDKAGNLIGQIEALEFTARGTSVLIANSNGYVFAWNPTTNKSATTHHAFMASLQNAATLVALSPDGTTVAVATSYAAQLWDMATGQQIGSPIVPGNGTFGDLAFSPDGKTLATGGDGTVRFWNVGYLTPAGAVAGICARIRPTIKAADWKAQPPAQAGMSYRRACAIYG
jgi:WD40 repeat protein